jgi:hypothetical protein
MIALTRWPPICAVALVLLGCADRAEAKRPSAFGDAYDARASTPPHAGDVDDVPDVARSRRPKAPRKMQRPRRGQRSKITLDGSQGTREEEIESDDDF